VNSDYDALCLVPGNVLIPVDAAGRLLEIILMLERYWDKNKLKYPLVLLSPVAYNVLEFAKSQLEWMADSVGRTFEHSRHNPFSLKCARRPLSAFADAWLPSAPGVVCSPFLSAALALLRSGWSWCAKRGGVLTAQAHEAVPLPE
jgi:cleavage and polyadenylation specificity factor subunit 2